MKAAALLLAAGASVGSAMTSRPPLQDLIDPLKDISMQCRWASPMGTSFDVSSMTKASNGAYTVGDMRDSTMSYIFNLCADVPVPSTNNNACQRVSSDPTGAFQIDLAQNDPTGQNTFCYRVGGPSMYGWNFSLYDSARPARGVVISMINGENTFCPYDYTTGVRRNRTFSVELLCANVAPQANYADASVIELNQCDYRMTLKSIAGCPLECLSSGSICGGHGVCGYDTDMFKSRCYCYTGYQGDDCATPIADAGGMGAETIILIVVCIVLCAVIGLVAFMFLKLRKLQVDPAAYGELQGRFNELGMLA